MTQSEWKSLKSRFGLINVSRPSARMGFHESRKPCGWDVSITQERDTGTGLSEGDEDSPPAPTPTPRPPPPAPEHCFPWQAFTDTQKMGVHCNPDHMAWVPPHCSRQGDSRLGGVGELRLDTTRQNILRCPHHSPTSTPILKMGRPRATGVLFHRSELSKPRDFRSSAPRTPLSWIFASLVATCILPVLLLAPLASVFLQD